AIFLFAFLPLVLAVYYIAKPVWRNTILLFFSLFFYAWGETFYVLLMLVSIGFNFSMAQQIQRQKSVLSRKWLVGMGVAGNLLLLGFFKYAVFLCTVFADIYQFGGGQAWKIPEIHLPIGISFFTFQAMSYLVDVYRGTVRGSVRFVDCALYISLFPQLIAGPIVRYHQIAEQIRSRVLNSRSFSIGIQRFIIGLAKKVLLADTAGLAADTIFSLSAEQVTTSMAWLAVSAYSLQIYFDFSGYSDMAIGLGRLFGFRFEENFNYPYIARSIKDFWRRWHISLSTWFRDYLYIPLGGSRGGKFRTYFNLWIVFVLCGLWHGAGWNFIVWGILHGVYLVLERLGLGRLLERLWRPLQHIYVLGLVMIGWVFFRTDTLGDAWIYLKTLVAFQGPDTVPAEILFLYNPSRLIFLACSVLFCFPIGKWFKGKMQSFTGKTQLSIYLEGLYYMLLLAIFVISLASIASNTYQPFIYFRF
ncbi:MBOAT family protein, partial [bacterium]|nr:MBOAT family protein [bacterium]